MEPHHILITSLNANTSAATYNLFYNGTPNGTASLAISASNVISTSYSVSSSNCYIRHRMHFYQYHHHLSSNSNSASVALSSNQSQTASYLINNGPKFIVPVTVASTINAVSFTYI